MMVISMDTPNTLIGTKDGQDLQFNLDTGATISVIPRELVSGKNKAE